MTMLNNSPTAKNISQAHQGDILVVDDNLDNLRLLATALSEVRYQVRLAASGPLALQAVAEKLPDLILLDITMPEMNGYQVCQQLKANPPTQDIPVIFLSGLDESLDKVQAFRVGGVD
jgi:CheY-like chemotaxis protein